MVARDDCIQALLFPQALAKLQVHFWEEIGGSFNIRPRIATQAPEITCLLPPIWAARKSCIHFSKAYCPLESVRKGWLTLEKDVECLTSPHYTETRGRKGHKVRPHSTWLCPFKSIPPWLVPSFPLTLKFRHDLPLQLLSWIHLLLYSLPPNWTPFLCLVSPI